MCCLATYGLEAVESLVSVNSQRRVLVPVINYNQRVVYMDEGTLLGHEEVYAGLVEVGHANVMSLHQIEKSCGTTDARVAVVARDAASHSESFFNRLQWPENIDSQDLRRLKMVVAGCALADDELGCTEVVQHKIDTGDQTPMPADKEKTAFTTHCGLFEFNRMPFGLCNAPSTFQRLMQTVLTGLEGKNCFVYIDDIHVLLRNILNT